MHLFFIILLGFSLLSCRGQESFIGDRLETANKILECLKNNQSDKILDYTYSGSNNISDKETRDFQVNKASKFINKFSIPDKSKWKVIHDPNNNFDRLLISIPVFSGYDSTFNLEKAEIVIAFPPAQISDKMYRLEIADKYKLKPTIPLSTTHFDSSNNRD
jgi:hypothetical protein